MVLCVTPMFRHLRKSRGRRGRNLRGDKRAQTEIGHSESESDKLVRDQLRRRQSHRRVQLQLHTARVSGRQLLFEGDGVYDENAVPEKQKAPVSVDEPDE